MRPKTGAIYFRQQLLETINWRGLSDGIAYLPQEPELAGPSVFSTYVCKKGADEAWNAELRFWIEFFRLSWSGDPAEYWSLSAGERSMATLCYLASHRPAVMLIDEPTSRISNENVERFLAEIRMRQPYIGVILVTHSNELLRSVCDESYELTSNLRRLLV